MYPAGARVRGRQVFAEKREPGGLVIFLGPEPQTHVSWAVCMGHWLEGAESLLTDTSPASGRSSPPARLSRVDFP